MSKLTPKQAKFCEEYLIDLNATQAAIRAGYSAKTAEKIAHENQRKPEIQARVEELRQLQQERTQVTADRVVEKLWKIATFDVRSVVTWDEVKGFEFKPIEDWDESARTVMGLAGTSNDGKPKFRAESKLSALESIGKHLGMFDNFNTAIATLKTYGINLRQSDSGWIVEDVQRGGS
jgi:phage terminase small subunit